MNWRNIKYSFGVLGILFFLCACAGKTEKQTEKSLNPNGDSELAILMRKMVKTLEENRALLLENKSIVHLPFEVNELLTATSTAGSINDRAAYESFTYNFIDSVNVFYTSDANKIRQFNGMVQACISCHETFCMGPIPVMERLKFTQTELDSLYELQNKKYAHF